GAAGLAGAAAFGFASALTVFATGFTNALAFGAAAGFADAAGAFVGAGRGARAVVTLAAVFPSRSSRVSFLLVPTLLMVVATRLLLRPTQSPVCALPWSVLPAHGRAC